MLTAPHLGLRVFTRHGTGAGVVLRLTRVDQPPIEPHQDVVIARADFENAGAKVHWLGEAIGEAVRQLGGDPEQVPGLLGDVLERVESLDYGEWEDVRNVEIVRLYVHGVRIRSDGLASVKLQDRTYPTHPDASRIYRPRTREQFLSGHWIAYDPAPVVHTPTFPWPRRPRAG